jgi:CBS domain-containing protein
MKVTKFMTQELVSCGPADTLERAAQLMWERDIGCVVVVDDTDRVVGIITDRDICMATYTRGELLRAIPVSAAMASPVHSCRDDHELERVEREMALHQIRRMPVLDAAGHAIGMISLSDIARGAHVHTAISSVEVASTLAEVCKPRRHARPPID